MIGLPGRPHVAPGHRSSRRAPARALLLTHPSGIAPVRSRRLCVGAAVRGWGKRPLDHVATLDSEPRSGPSGLSDAELRRRISQAVWRALAEPAYAQALLADPSILLRGAGCAPQQRRDIERLRAPTIRQFAYLAEASFWPSVTGPS